MIQHPKLNIVLLPEKEQPILSDRHILTPFVANDAYIRRVLERKQMLQAGSYWHERLVEADLLPVMKNIALLCPFVVEGKYNDKKVHHVFFERASTRYNSAQFLEAHNVRENEFVWKIITE